MAKSAKCEHDSCSCMVTEGGKFGKYCSAHCQDAKDMAELRCECGHPGCTAATAGGK